MLFLRLLGWVNFKWNCGVGWIHDLSAKWGVGHWTVWFYDTFRWTLPNHLQLIGGKRYAEYMLEYELRIANHQINYYSNLAADWMLAYFRTLPEVEEEDSKVKVADSEVSKSEVKG